MADLKQAIARQLPYLRRYGRALTGAQEQGDRLIRTVLEGLAARRLEIDRTGNIKTQLYRLLNTVADQAAAAEGAVAVNADAEARLQAKLQSLSTPARRALLLLNLEGLSMAEVAAVMALSFEALDALFAQARDDLKSLAATRVLVIEDEPVIALHVAEIVRESGHEVAGIATSKDEAIRLAAETVPGLILCDIQLDDGSTGIEAAQEILKAIDVPIIFVTAFPERLLTGERMEPTYLVAKPFEPETLTITMAQALFHHPSSGRR